MKPEDLQRLALIKYLFSVGVYQSYQPEPLNGISILAFHDSVELFLELCLQELNLSKKDHVFMNYWDIINNALEGKRLSQEESMKRLNEARRGLKHSGNPPSRLSIEAFRVNTLEFFRENCLIVFKIKFDDISLIDLIKYQRSRELLKQAGCDFEKGSVYESIQNLILSFKYLIQDYEESKKDRFLRSPFFFGKPESNLSSIHLGSLSQSAGFKQFADKMRQSLNAIQDAIKILSFGIDYRKYVKYKSIVSCIEIQTSDGGQEIFYRHGQAKLGREDLDFCINFIVESALKLQEFDFELAKQ